VELTYKPGSVPLARQ